MNNEFEEEVIFTEDTPTEEEMEESKEEFRFGFASLLDFVAVACLVMGVIAAGLFTEDGYDSHDAVAVTLYLVGGIFSAIWWHCAAIVVEACHKYLGKK